MTKGPVSPPSVEELQDFCLGRCEPRRAAEIESFLADGPNCDAVLAAAPDDALVRRLRGAGALAGPGRAGWSNTLTGATPGTDRLAGATDTGLLEFQEHPRYRFLRKLGQGGMGTVYLAEHRVMRRLVAIKLLRESPGRPQLTDRFRQEVQAAAALSHPHLVTAHDADEIDGTPFLVMEYVEGESLDRRLARDGPLPASLASALIRQAALGLEFIRQAGMVHRDIKPHNLMVVTGASVDTPGTVKVLDFGLARVLRPDAPTGGSLTDEQTILGTADYMAPEQARDSRTADTRADVYSLGCTLYQLLTGRVPYPGGVAMDKILRHASARPEPLGDAVPPGLVAVVNKMMARDPDERYQTPAAVAAALEPFTTGGSDTIVAPPPRPRRRGLRWGLLALVGCLFLAVGFLIWHWYGTSSGSSATEPAGNDAPARTAREKEPVGLLRLLPAQGANLRNTKFSPDGKYVLAVAWGFVCVWEADTGKLLHTLLGTAGWWSAVFTADSRGVIYLHSDGILRRWDVGPGTSAPLKHLDFRTGSKERLKDVEPFAVSADGKYLACIFTASDKSARYVLLDLVTGKQLCQIRPLSSGQGLSPTALFSADGKRFYTADISRKPLLETTLRIWDVAAGKQAKSFRVANMADGRLAFGARGRWLGFDYNRGGHYYFAFIDLASGQPAHDVAMAQTGKRSLGFAGASGRWYGSISEKGDRVDFYDLSTGKAVFTHKGIPVPSVGAFSADGRYAAVPGQGGVWLFRLPSAGGGLQ
jgi:hypothetical protein